MKTLALAISTALISSSVLAGNTATTLLKNSTNDTVHIMQISPAAGSEAIVELSDSIKADVVIHQENDKNYAKVVGVDAIENSDVNIYQNGTENVTNVALATATGTGTDLDIYGNQNQVAISVSESDGNKIKSAIGNESEAASDNTLNVVIDSLSNGNTITTTQLSSENLVDVNISESSQGNDIYATQNAELNKIGINITTGSSNNVLEVIQVSERSTANISLADNSVDNSIYLVQSLSDIATINMTSATNSSVNIVQY